MVIEEHHRDSSQPLNPNAELPAAPVPPNVNVNADDEPPTFDGRIFSCVETEATEREAVVAERFHHRVSMLNDVLKDPTKHHRLVEDLIAHINH